MYFQDYLYLFQASAGIGAFLSVFLVFRYETIDKYADNRKEALREILDIRNNPQLARWIQMIGKSDTGKGDFDKELKKLNKPSVDIFIDQIVELRAERMKLGIAGTRAIIVWAIVSIAYLVAHACNLYESPIREVMLIGFIVPLGYSASFMRVALGPLH